MPYSINDITLNDNLYPNPSNEFIHISNISKDKEYKIVNTLGEVVSEGHVIKGERINKNKYTLKFIKC